MDGVALSMVSLRLDNQCKVFSPVFVWLVRILSLSFQEVIIYKNSCNLLFPTGTLVCKYKLMFMRILVFEFFLLEHSLQKKCSEAAFLKRGHRVEKREFKLMWETERAVPIP